MTDFAIFMGTIGFALCWLIAIVKFLRWLLHEDERIRPLDAVDRLGSLVDDEQRARLHKRMHGAR